MKLTVLIFLVATLQVVAEASYAQQVSIQKKNATLLEVLQTIRKQTGYLYVCDLEMLKKAQKVSLDVKNASIKDVLDECFANQLLTYQLVDKTIIVKKREPESPISRPESLYKQPQPPSLYSTIDGPGLTLFLDKVPLIRNADIAITGKVTDEKDEALPGVNVVLKGTQTGTTTDAGGNFKINVPNRNSVLIFSSVGFQSQEVQVGAKTRIDLKMVVDNKALDEVVVVGYGELKKSDFTGAASKVSLEGAQERPYASFDGALQGRVAGVQITANTGTPGGEMTFRVRGSTSTTGDNQPLIVVDGFPLVTNNSMITAGSEGTITDIRGASGLSIINPNDIESIEVLKDASATAIYGSRGANGVIMITTKRGKNGRDKVEYSSRMDFGDKPKDMGLLSTREFMDLWNEAYRNTNPSATKPYFTALDYATMPDINWQDLVLQKSFGQTHSLTLSGGDPKMRYSAFGSYADLDGSVKYASNFKRGTMRLNLDREVSTRFKFGVSVSGEMIKNQAVGQSNSNGNVNGSIINALLTAPLNNPYDAYGDLVNLRGANGGVIRLR
ncbi:SusC/RagA family TonB-linked outer membrane protein [Spirosoma telluris]